MKTAFLITFLSILSTHPRSLFAEDTLPVDCKQFTQYLSHNSFIFKPGLRYIFARQFSAIDYHLASNPQLLNCSYKNSDENEVSRPLGVLLQEAADGDDTNDVIQYLLAKKPEVNFSCKYDQTPLHYAVFAFKATTKVHPIVETMVKLGANINSVSQYEVSIFENTLRSRTHRTVDFETLQFLFANGGNPNSVYNGANFSKGKSFMHRLSAYPIIPEYSSELITLALKYGGDLEQQTKVYQYTPILYAAAICSSSGIKALYDQGADINKTSANGAGIRELVGREVSWNRENPSDPWSSDCLATEQVLIKLKP